MENTKTVNVTFNSEIDGKRYEGLFTFKRLTVKDTIELGVRKTRLTGGFHFAMDESGSDTGRGIDMATEFRSTMLATLSLCILQHPDWWPRDIINEDFYDDDLLAHVYDKYMEYAEFFRGGKGSNNVLQKASTPNVEGQGSNDNSKDLVDKKVPKLVEV